MSGTELGADAELMMPSSKGSGWRPPREASVPVAVERRRDEDLRRPAARALDKILSRKLNDD